VCWTALSGSGYRVVSERARHSDIGITLKVYSHVIPGMQEDVAKRLDASLRLVLENAP
jgi:integrase